MFLRNYKRKKNGKLHEYFSVVENISYLVGTPRAMLDKFEDRLVDLDWKAANDNVDVKLLAEDKELYVLAKSKDRRAK